MHVPDGGMVTRSSDLGSDQTLFFVPAVPKIIVNKILITTTIERPGRRGVRFNRDTGHIKGWVKGTSDCKSDLTLFCVPNVSTIIAHKVSLIPEIGRVGREGVATDKRTRHRSDTAVASSQDRQLWI